MDKSRLICSTEGFDYKKLKQTNEMVENFKKQISKEIENRKESNKESSKNNEKK
ncbi:hypothetical protein [Campylobacter armoricus]|uniref:hypothetical protein n=1 Tax=Campylobacter armoricus TaxID=2505970 RepID=UPI0013756619|nr:hypothetical protein [Campylobacter armoricus]